MSLNVIFMGSPEFSVPVLLEIINNGHHVVACYSQPPRQAGRGKNLRKTAVHEQSDRLGIKTHTPDGFDDETIATFQGYNADVAIVVAYGLLLPKAILNAPKYGCLNIHASLLPRWRGAAPIQRAIMAGDPQTGVMLMQMDEGLDTGPIGWSRKHLLHLPQLLVNYMIRWQC